MRRLYIAGPMTGYPGLNFPAFSQAAFGLRAAGFEVVNPAELNPPGLTWEQCMRTDLAQLVTCQGVAVLPDWDRSRGATLEVHVAQQLAMPVRRVAEWLF
ncbi:hypothetical protein C1M51_18440 [Methylibium sp. Pch-M]|uniref:DUF4406 domain-containing protein n=1 Tax=Methylibium sp. Pch-M TaxID=2082386 RepID=UPI0010107ED0|nr:DUF4406 domain-containing protein [Methylibium sp. Pch-M]QAZ41239.1 hypothetical protein C1M51_18440 [Methylibium sp. Pch-M]